MAVRGEAGVHTVSSGPSDETAKRQCRLHSQVDDHWAFGWGSFRHIYVSADVPSLVSARRYSRFGVWVQLVLAALSILLFSDRLDDLEELLVERVGIGRHFALSISQKIYSGSV